MKQVVFGSMKMVNALERSASGKTGKIIDKIYFAV